MLVNTNAFLGVSKSQNTKQQKNLICDRRCGISKFKVHTYLNGPTPFNKRLKYLMTDKLGQTIPFQTQIVKKQYQPSSFMFYIKISGKHGFEDEICPCSIQFYRTQQQYPPELIQLIQNSVKQDKSLVNAHTNFNQAREMYNIKLTFRQWYKIANTYLNSILHIDYEILKYAQIHNLIHTVTKHNNGYQFGIIHQLIQLVKNRQI
ncbi:Hypothetical_protein [Hexamita inflata]|uniref:Hypothetical_protein n=1 Tax=Hexamita inflata TaxID=28002 RepID=A0AA86R3V0_9EUKA|nr:Hypothetical protein HINF_LOCUS56053 [Hexamita inflata]